MTSSAVLELEDVPAKWRYVMNCREVPGGVPTSREYAVMLEVMPHEVNDSGNVLASYVVTGNVTVPKVIGVVPVEWK